MSPNDWLDENHLCDFELCFAINIGFDRLQTQVEMTVRQGVFVQALITKMSLIFIFYYNPCRYYCRHPSKVVFR